MIECWRWFGPLDAIPLADVRQTGASGIVTALHEIPAGAVWPREAIAARAAEIRAAGLRWEVVESLPVHEDIKRGTATPAIFAAYRQSMANLAAEGIATICYNFMPLLDWTRTDLAAPVAGGGTCLRFDAVRMAAFEIHMLGRAAAEGDYPAEVVARAAAWAAAATQADRDGLLHTIMSGLPGAFDRYDVAGLRAALTRYEGLGRADLRAAFARFAAEVMPAAEALGIALCIHPDDPPRDILGLPRICSDGEDVAALMAAHNGPANGLTLCSGSLGAHPANDVPAIAARFAERIRFAHLRNVRREADGSFEEAAHLDGDADMVALVRVLLAAQARRGAPIPFRPDHGHALLGDAASGAHPGYPLIGRLRGLAELRGVVRALRDAPGG